MKSYKFLDILLILSIFSLSQTIIAHERNETDDFKEVLEKILILKKNSQASTLLVLDIDNTLLANKTELGSDQWFEWQTSLLMTPSTKSQLAVTKSIPELIALYSKLQGFVDVRLTQTDLPEILKKINGLKIPILFLTSRGPILRSVTEASLSKLNLMPSKSLLSNQSFQQVVIPNSPVAGNFQNGIFLTAGAHKGVALNLILTKLRKNFKHIVFVDDHQKHTDRVYETFSVNQYPEIITYRYGKEDINVNEFKRSDKKKVHAQFLKLKNTIKEVFDYSL